MKPGRNDPCPCGSGKKYKKCCLPRQQGTGGASPRASRLLRSSAGGSGALAAHAPPVEDLPLLVDAGSGEPSRMVTDHWKVHDWDALAEALEAQPDVQGSREESWVRLEDPDRRMPRPLLSLNPGEDDWLETFGLSRRRADEGREWLLAVAGDAVEHVSREEVDPMAALAEMRKGRSSPGDLPLGLQTGSSPFSTSKPLTMTTEMMQAILEGMYRDWPDEPIPALDDRTPRQAMETPEGRKKVIRLLELYEEGEVEHAREQDREPATFEFLWRAMGLERE